MSEKIFISGIDTDAGKTYATAWLAMHYIDQGKSVITQKFIQTGNVGSSEDIEAHRRLMGIEMLPDDLDHTTAPIIFSYPASAQLAARIDNRSIDFDIIDRAASALASRYDIVLIEGAGGLMVPITDQVMQIDYPATRQIPVALVTNGKLGSINHTILSLQAIKAYGIKLHSVLYNSHFDNDKVIAEDTFGFITRYVQQNFPGTPIFVVPTMK